MEAIAGFSRRVDKLPCSVHEGREKCWRFPRKKSFYVGVHCRHHRVLPEKLLLAPEFDAAHFLPFLALFLAALFATLLALLRHLEKL